MKKVILVLIVFAACLASCKNLKDPMLAKTDFQASLYDYDYKVDSVKMSYMNKVRESNYRPSSELKDTIEVISENIISECLDRLYDEYSNDIINRLFSISENVELNGKKEMHEYFLNNAVNSIMDGITTTVNVEKTLHPTEQDIKEFIEKNVKI